jgi:NtrC-family two-component system sensor histidine kinase KinB
MTLRRRLLLAQVPLAAALLVVGAASLQTVAFLGDSSETILQDNYRSVLAAQRMGDALDGLDREALLRALGQAPGEPADALRERFESELKVQEGNVTEPGEGEATERLRAAWNGYRAQEREQAGAREKLPAYLGPLQKVSISVRAAIDEVLALNQDAMVRKSNQARRSAQRLLQLMMVATAGALALGLFASFALTARIVKPLSSLSLAVRRFGEGDLQSRAIPRLEEYRKSSLGDLIQAQQASQAAIDSLPDPVLVLDASGGVLNLNRAAESLLKLGPGEGAGTPIHALDPVLRERVEAIRAHVLSGKGAVVPRGFEEAIRVDLQDGPHRLLPRATALYSEEGAVTGVTVVLQDVTRLVRFDELKNDLVATVAHEFRTPLTSLRMAVHMCAEEVAGPLTTQQADLMAAARQDCERLQGIVDDILDLSRIQAGRIELQARSVDPVALVQQSVRQADGSARAGGGLRAPGRPGTDRRRARQPARQCRAPHPTGWAGGGSRAPDRCRGPVRGPGLGGGYPRAVPGAGLRAVLPDPRIEAWRSGARALHLPRGRSCARRGDGRDERGRQGKHLLVHAPAPPASGGLGLSVLPSCAVATGSTRRSRGSGRPRPVWRCVPARGGCAPAPPPPR